MKAVESGRVQWTLPLFQFQYLFRNFLTCFSRSCDTIKTPLDISNQPDPAQENMLTDTILQNNNGSQGNYLQDDIARGLRTSLVQVLSATLADKAHPDFLKGVLTLARCQADLYDIPWHNLIQSLCAIPELYGLIAKLQECPPPVETPPTGQ